MIDLLNMFSLLHGWTGHTAWCRCSEGGKLVVPISSHPSVLGVLDTSILLPVDTHWDQLGCSGMAPLTSVRAPLLWQNPFLWQGSVAFKFAQNRFY